MLNAFHHLQMIKLSKAVEEELKTTVVQAYEAEPGKYGTCHIYYYICVYIMWNDSILITI
jgi:hypothetical protein